MAADIEGIKSGIVNYVDWNKIVEVLNIVKSKAESVDKEDLANAESIHDLHPTRFKHQDIFSNTIRVYEARNFNESV